uniref:Secreted protein n=1 Tax=Heterorhabditis bacteriophora TaxID=37862 RepID=A0A1I7XQN2_HETBA
MSDTDIFIEQLNLILILYTIGPGTLRHTYKTILRITTTIEQLNPNTTDDSFSGFCIYFLAGHKSFIECC